MTANVSSDGDTWLITGVQLELGDAATEFEHESYAQTLSKCQRYFFRWQGSAYSFIAHGYAYSNQHTNLIFHPPVPMRAIPTISSTGNWRICSDVCTNVSSIIFSGGSNYSLTINGLTSSTSLNSGNAYMIGNNNDASATLDLIAEL